MYVSRLYSIPDYYCIWHFEVRVHQMTLVAILVLLSWPFRVASGVFSLPNFDWDAFGLTLAWTVPWVVHQVFRIPLQNAWPLSVRTSWARCRWLALFSSKHAKEAGCLIDHVGALRTRCGFLCARSLPSWSTFSSSMSSRSASTCLWKIEWRSTAIYG